MDEELAGSEIAFPDSSVLENTEIYINLSNEAKQLMDELWISIVRSNELTLSFWITVGVIAVASLTLVFRNMYIKKKRLEARKKY
jgi:abortive infection bacteriophage resistance protein